MAEVAAVGPSGGPPGPEEVVLRRLRERNRAEAGAYRMVCEDYQALAVRCAAAEAKARGLERRNAALAQEKKDLKEELIRTGEAIQQSEHTQHLEKRNKELSESLTQSYKESSQIAQELAAKTIEVTALRDTLTETEGKLQAAEERASGLDARLQEATAELETHKAAREAADLELRERLDTKEALEKQVAVLEAENVELVQRLLEQKEKEIDLMNMANAVYRDAAESRSRASSMRGGASATGGPPDPSPGGPVEVLANPATCPEQLKILLKGSHDNMITSLCYDNLGNKFASGGEDNSVKTWEGARGNGLSTLHGSLGTVLDVHYAPDMKSICASAADHTLRLWDLQSGRTKHTLTGHKDKVWGFGYSGRDHLRCVSGGADRTIKVWDMSKGYCLQTIMCGSTCFDVCMSFDGSTVISGHFDGSLRLWDYRTGAFERDIKGLHGSQLVSIQMGLLGNALLTCGRDNLLKLVDLRMMEATLTFQAPGFRLHPGHSKSCPAMAPDETFVACGGADSAVYVWNTRDGRQEATLQGHTAPVICCAWSPAGGALVSGDASGAIAMWH